MFLNVMPFGAVKLAFDGCARNSRSRRAHVNGNADCIAKSVFAAAIR
jgi:hypothetical protein